MILLVVLKVRGFAQKTISRFMVLLPLYIPGTDEVQYFCSQRKTFNITHTVHNGPRRGIPLKNSAQKTCTFKKMKSQHEKYDTKQNKKRHTQKRNDKRRRLT